ncbi:cell division cycle protein 27 homolog B [Citrus clementina]|nr:cell division cycle protein 27 homolog B [Citrus x clementina]XP_024033378.1 cell division cycle protein 27 homolog B [Citrus x clementina]
MEGILTDCVQNSLRYFMYRNAIFLCERLCAEFPSEVNLQLLATCYLQNNQAYAAYNILKGTQMALSRYLFAVACYQMDLLSEAEAALSPVNEPSVEIPNGAAGHYLMGLIYRYTDRRKNAIHHYKMALSIDPLLWAAYEELCMLGAAEEATAVFSEAAALCIQKQYLQNGLATQNLYLPNEDRNLVSSKSAGTEDISPRQLKHMQANNLRDIPGNYHGAAVSAAAASQPLNGGPSNASFYNTPSPITTQLSGVAPPPLCRNLQPNGPNLNMLGTDSSPKSTISSTIQAPRRKFVDEGKLRKISGRLFSDSGPRRSTRLAGEAGANANMSTTTVAGNGTTNSSKYLGGSKLSSVALRSVTLRKGQSWANENIDEGMRNEPFDDSRANTASTVSSSFPTSDTRSAVQEGTTVPIGGTAMNGSRIMTGASDLLGLLRILGEGYRMSCMYRCKDALDVYLKLPHKHYNTGWVLSQVGKAYFEVVDYLEAERAFTLARRASPYSLEGMDIYSTVLYHLKEDMKLSYLAQELITTDRLAPQSWCAMGNCYSLQKDHETALKNFQRAVQLNPRFAYGHTLCGHEYVALEDFENGIRSYQSALRVDARHYNSWYGLGMVYLRQEKFEFSEHHFRMAFQISPHSSVIMSYLGTAMHALKRSGEAIEMMEKAILADKKNPLPMYQKANILLSLEKFDEALEVLEELKEYAPRESGVYALMGKIYKRRNMHEKAMLHFGLALDLKPSATDVATIKAAIEKLHVPDEIEDNLRLLISRSCESDLSFVGDSHTNRGLDVTMGGEAATLV